MSIQIPQRVKEAFGSNAHDRFRIAFEEVQSNMQAQPDTTRSAAGVYVIRISTSEGGAEEWVLDLTKPPGRVFAASGSGAESKPDCTLSMKEEHFVDIVFGRKDAMAAYICGNVRVKGSLVHALKLSGVLSKGLKRYAKM